MALYASDGSFNVTLVDGNTRTGLQAADGSLNVVIVDGLSYVGRQHPCGAYNVVLATEDSNQGLYHSSGALRVSQSPYYTGSIRVTFAEELTLDAPTLDWDDEIVDNLPDFTMSWDAQVNDIATIRRSTDINFSSYEDVSDTVLSLDPPTDLEFDFGDVWVDGTWYVSAYYTRNGVTSELADTETLTIDTTGPTLITPVDTETGQTTASLSATTQEANVTVYTVVTTSATPPTASQVAAGDDHTDTNAAYASSALKATAGAQAFSATGLTAATGYYTYFVGEDANGNLGPVLSADGFTTDAAELSFDGVQAKLNADLTGQNITSLTLLAFNATDILDTNSWHDPASNNTRITIPSGVSYVQFYGQARLVNATGNETLELTLRKNGSAAGLATEQVSALMSYGGANMSNQIVSYPMAVTPGDYFELQVQVQADTSVDLMGAYCWLSAMKVG